MRSSSTATWCITSQRWRAACATVLWSSCGPERPTAWTVTVEGTDSHLRPNLVQRCVTTNCTPVETNSALRINNYTFLRIFMLCSWLGSVAGRREAKPHQPSVGPHRSTAIMRASFCTGATRHTHRNEKEAPDFHTYTKRRPPTSTSRPGSTLTYFLRRCERSPRFSAGVPLTHEGWTLAVMNMSGSCRGLLQTLVLCGRRASWQTVGAA